MTTKQKNDFLYLGEQKRNGSINLSWAEIGNKIGLSCSADSVRNRWKALMKKQKPERNSISMTSNSSNTLNVEIPTDRIVTLDDALKLCGVDLEVWEVERWKFNKWEVGRKDKQVDMSYEDGISNGSVKDSGKINVEPLYKIYISFIRKQPVRQEFPCIQPIKIDTKYTLPATPHGSSNDILEALLIPDIHFGFNRRGREFEPFHDRKALDLILQVIKDRKPPTIVLMGDLLDMTEWSDKFIKRPEFYFTTQPALEEAAWWLARIRNEAENARIIYIEGNHESRMRKQLFSHMLSAYGLKRVNQEHNEDALSIPYLLALDELGIEYKKEYPRSEFWLNDRMKLIHGSVVSSKSGGSVSKMIQDTHVSVGMGHIHRIEKVEKAVHVRNKTEILSVFSMGTLARLDGVVPSRNGKENWQQGFGYVYYKAGNGHVQPNLVSITDGACIFEGKEYSGIDNSENVEQVLKFRERF
jgi:hypothetical protein